MEKALNRPEVMIAQAQNKSDDQGCLTDETTRKFIGDLLVALADWARRLDAKAEERRRPTTPQLMSGRVAGAADGGRSASKNPARGSAAILGLRRSHAGRGADPSAGAGASAKGLLEEDRTARPALS